jgi:sterol desaturase/sphingolipid hydroxylase (fatty acid hydroxylase superfamily)
MPEFVMSLFNSAASSLLESVGNLLIPAGLFIALAMVLKGRDVLSDARRALPEVRTTLLFICFNAVFVVPFFAIFSTWTAQKFSELSLTAIHPDMWAMLPSPIVTVIAIFVGDLIGYWRHRAEHLPMLWPSHAIHHSDQEMTWLTLERFHPINRVTTFAIDNGLMFLLGFPSYAIIANNLVRHYYGYYVHADLPWTHGKLGKIFVSPAMHRWHHAADTAAINTNYATVFSIIDRWFGTFRVPGPCAAPLGVTDDFGGGPLSQLAYPLQPRAYRRSVRSTVDAPHMPPLNIDRATG